MVEVADVVVVVELEGGGDEQVEERGGRSRREGVRKMFVIYVLSQSQIPTTYPSHVVAMGSYIIGIIQSNSQMYPEYLTIDHY